MPSNSSISCSTSDGPGTSNLLPLNLAYKNVFSVAGCEAGHWLAILAEPTIRVVTPQGCISQLFEISAQSTSPSLSLSPLSRHSLDLNSAGVERYLLRFTHRGMGQYKYTGFKGGASAQIIENH